MNKIHRLFITGILPAVLSLLLNATMCSTLKAQETAGQKKNTAFRPGAVWLDKSGLPINAHGGGILYINKVYYWFGEKRGTQASEGVSVYSSKDLYNWKDEGLALAQSNDPQSDITVGCLMERPKVIYNKKTDKYVMWFHLELKGKGYAAARAGVAISDKATGPYRFVSSFRPNGNMSRDMNLFVDDDGAAYHIYSSDENMDLRIVRLSDDFLTATTQDVLLFRKQQEGPALFKTNGEYYLITSGCTGWAPNKASLHKSKNIFGPWEYAGNPMVGEGANLTFGGQSTAVLPVQGKKNAFIFMADKWNPKDLKDSRHFFLPIQLNDGQVKIEWMDKWSLDWFNERH